MFPGILIAQHVGVTQVARVVRHDDAMRLERPDMRQDFRPLRGGVFVGVLLNPQQVNRPVVGQHLGQLFFDLSARDIFTIF